MKICPNCKRKYFDDEGNYCFNCRYLLKHIDGTDIDNRSELPINDTVEICFFLLIGVSNLTRIFIQVGVRKSEGGSVF